MTLQLLDELIKLAPNDQFILLASAKNFDELRTIQAPNIEVTRSSNTQRINLRTIFPLLVKACTLPWLKLANHIRLPGFILRRLWNLYGHANSQLLASSFELKIEADLLFCPFTAPFFRDLKIPIVSVIYDLQSHYHPHFFTIEEQQERRRNFEDACYWAEKLICISDFVKQTVMDNSRVSPNDIKTIYIRLAHRLPNLEKETVHAALTNLQLTPNHFLLYPANFWAHKNHKMLFTAFNMYRKKHPTSTLKLICTGADNQQKRVLLNIIQQMGLTEQIIIPGYLSDHDFSCLVEGSRAIIFPSLYEGFGMPLLEAMANGKPVLCSNLTSLPEVAGNAALLFDPRKPHEIVDAIHRIESEPALCAQLIERGHQRVAEFGSARDMAQEYLQVFRDLLPTASTTS